MQNSKEGHNTRMAEMCAETKALLDVMTLLHLNNTDGGEHEGTGLNNVEGLLDDANAQFRLKYSTMKKGLRKGDPESGRTGYQNNQESEEDRYSVNMLDEESRVLQKEESVLVNENMRCHINGLPQLVKTSTDLIHMESISQKECRRMHEKNYFQAVLLQKLCKHTDVPEDKQDYIDNLCNSVLEGAYDFCNT